MKLPKDSSFGVIPIRYRKNGQREYLAIKHVAGHWDFPKGHLEAGETEKEAAARELTEETGFTVTKWLDVPAPSINYLAERDGKAVNKTVTFFVAEVAGKKQLGDKQVQDIRWFLYVELQKTITYLNSRDLLERVDKGLN